MTLIEGLLRRERVIAAAGLAVIAVLAWIYVWRGAGMGMSAIDMTTLTLFPHLQPHVAGEMDDTWLMIVAMWWVMMVAMMTPGAAPLVLLYMRVMRGHGAAGKNIYLPSLLLLTGYLAVWLAFSAVAATLQNALQPAGLISAMMWWSRSALLSAGILATAGLYQLSPLKRACLAQCRSPVRFLTQYGGTGLRGSFMLGVRHGAFCVGCCWMLMALLFVGGVMNLVWIAMLTLLVLAEKLLPAGETVGKITGGMLLVWAAATLIV
jgi:predicted metal-binding membrane protein